MRGGRARVGHGREAARVDVGVREPRRDGREAGGLAGRLRRRARRGEVVRTARFSEARLAASSRSSSASSPTSRTSISTSRSSALRLRVIDGLSGGDTGVDCGVVEQREQLLISRTLTRSMSSCTYDTVLTSTSSLNSFSPFDFSSTSTGLEPDAAARCFSTSLTRLLSVASVSLIFVRRAFSMREWLSLRWDSRAERESGPGLRPRRLGAGTGSTGS